MSEGREIRLRFPCNNHCWHCPWAREPTASADEVLERLREAVRDGVHHVRFTRGELLVHPQARRILTELKALRLTFSLVTNARVFANRQLAASLRASGLSSVTVRAFASSAFSYGWACRTPGFREMLDGTVQLARLDLLDDFEVPVSRENKGELVNIAILLRRISPRPVRFVPVDEQPFEAEIDRANAFLDRVRDPAPVPVGDIVLEPVGDAPDFDPERCTFKTGLYPLEQALQHLFLQQGRGYRIFRTRTPVEDDRLRLVKNLRQLALAGPEARPLELEPACLGCAALHRCFGCFRERAPRSAVTPSESAVELRHPADLKRVVDAGHEDGRVEVRGALCACLLDEGRGVLARPPQLVEPWELADFLRAHGGTIESYELPSRTGEPWFSLTIAFDLGSIEQRADEWRLFLLFLASACVARCIMCNIPASLGGKFLPLPHAEAFLEEIQLAGADLVDLFGGEVTLRHDLPVIVRLAKTMNLKCMVITTGYLVSDPEHLRELTDAGVDHLEVSVDSAQPFLHDHIRGRTGLFERALKAIANIAAEGRASLSVNTVIMTLNYGEVADIHRLVADAGARRHNFFYCVQAPGEPSVRLNLAGPMVPDFFEKRQPTLLALASDRGTEVSFGPDIQPPAPIDSAFVERISRGAYTPEADCAAIGHEFVLSFDGQVHPCLNPGALSLLPPAGNLFRERLLDVVRHALTDEPLLRLAGHTEACRNCISMRT